jgi:hypothetical protein
MRVELRFEVGPKLCGSSRRGGFRDTLSRTYQL